MSDPPIINAPAVFVRAYSKKTILLQPTDNLKSNRCKVVDIIQYEGYSLKLMFVWWV